MSEPDINPQRQPANPDAEPSHPTAELPRVDRGQSDSSAAPAGAMTPAGAEAPASAGDPVPSEAAPASPAPAPAGPQGGPSVPGGVAQGGPPAPGVPHGGPAATPPQGIPGPVPGPFPPSPWYPAHPQSAHPHSTQQNQPGWMGNASYPGQHTPGGPVPPPPGHADGGPLPPWAQPVPAGSAPRSNRLTKGVVTAVAALALMAGSGVAGGFAALALDDGTTNVTRTYSAAPIVNSADLPAIANKVQSSVVSINTGSAEGSGVVLTADGYILTNNHVVDSANGGTVRVVLADGKSATAKIVGTDPKTDLAVVKASGVSGLNAATFGDSDAMQVGDTVLALGSPLGLQGSVTAGIISARDRTIQTGDEQQQNPLQQQQSGPASSISGLLQTDAPINPGNSGGALVNTKGEVIGINTAIATAGSNGNIGVGFAIPSNKAKAVAEALQKGQKVSHPYLGVGVTGSENGGAVVSTVNPGSPAEQAGLQQGDVVTRFGDKTINSSDDLVAAVQSGKVGDRVQLTFTRNGAEKTATVTLAETS